eukprot:1789027-Rhodomonas_salina.1
MEKLSSANLSPYTLSPPVPSPFVKSPPCTCADTHTTHASFCQTSHPNTHRTLLPALQMPSTDAGAMRRTNAIAAYERWEQLTINCGMMRWKVLFLYVLQPRNPNVSSLSENKQTRDPELRCYRWSRPPVARS